MIEMLPLYIIALSLLVIAVTDIASFVLILSIHKQLVAKGGASGKSQCLDASPLSNRRGGAGALESQTRLPDGKSRK